MGFRLWKNGNSMLCGQRTREEKRGKCVYMYRLFVLWFPALYAFFPFDMCRTRVAFWVNPFTTLNRCDKFDVVNCNENLSRFSDRFFGGGIFRFLSGRRIFLAFTRWYQENALTRIKIWIEISKNTVSFYRKTLHDLFFFLFQLKNINDVYIVRLKKREGESNKKGKKLFHKKKIFSSSINIDRFSGGPSRTDKRISASFPSTFCHLLSNENTSTIESRLKCNQFC